VFVLKGGVLIPPFFYFYMQPIEVIDQIQKIFLEKGNLNYGENITQIEHAVQCWTLAVESGYGVELRVAAFLHDIGHLYYDESESKSDMRHEILAAEVLSKWGFSERMVQIVESHVWAKRWLVTHDQSYYNNLSEASKLSLVKQGGFLSEEEIEQYKHYPFFEDSLQLRRWDDEGKREDISQDIPQEVWLDIAKCLSL
jgi:putative nucleotidyltransferase with HDIG domain